MRSSAEYANHNREGRRKASRHRVVVVARARMKIQRNILGPGGPTKRARARARCGATARRSGFHRSHAGYQVISDYSVHVRGRIALYGRDESARLVPHPPRPSFERSHTTPRACAYVPARGAREGREGTARCHYDRRTDGRTDGGASNHTERGEVGARTGTEN